MAKRRYRLPGLAARGFSLVEMLVAMLFTGLLMAGMAKVFSSSLSTFYTSGETLSSFRRNRAATDMLYDDLNAASMYITSLSTPPSEVANTNPAFYVLPNMPIAGAGADDPPSADQLLFYLDQPLPFEGTYAPGAGGGARSATEIIAAGGAVAATDNQYVVDCGDANYANQVKLGMSMVFKDAWESAYITAATPSGSSVTVTVGQNAAALVSGLGATGTPSKSKHLPGSGVLFYTPSQAVRYSVQIRLLDPQNPAGVPCLIREQGTYRPAGFVAATDAIITENVSGFKVYLSVDSGKTWAGFKKTYTGMAGGWTGGILADLNTVLLTTGRPDFTSTNGIPDWFRSIPTLVRLDITTRSAVKRSEYSATPGVTKYQDVVQTIVTVPRHSGLPIN